MELMSMEFLSALAAIVVIDLVLAGDNAIVIALAARGLPPLLRRRAIVWGSIAAVAMRSLMTLAVVWLLKVPGLMAIGGLLLIVIAYRLLVTDDDDGAHPGVSATTFFGAMRTIVVADALMGLDNVLAVAGAAHGSYLLVVLGLLISVPIVVWGSTMILRWVERFPVIVYLGSAVLAVTAVKMVIGDPVVAGGLPDGVAGRALVAGLYGLALAGVLGGGFLANHRQLESRITAHIAAFRATLLARGDTGEHTPLDNFEGGAPMQRILIPVDGSASAEFAVRHVIARHLGGGTQEIHLLNVQPRVPRHVARFLRRRDLDAWHREMAEQALAPARRLLEQHNVPHAEHHSLGDRAATIVAEARRLNCHLIVMNTARRRTLARMLQASTTVEVLKRTTVPVELISGARVSLLEGWGIPAGVGALIGMILMASD